MSEKPVNKIVYPTRSLLQGGEYTHSSKYSLRERFEQMAELAKQQQPKQALRRAK